MPHGECVSPYPAVQASPAAFGATHTPTTVEHNPDAKQSCVLEASPAIPPLQSWGGEQLPAEHQTLDQA